MKQVDAFRYRMTDALRAVTRLAIRDARTKELKRELLASDKLKRHFEENPMDLVHLRHDGESRAVRIQPHLKHVPDYLMPTSGKAGLAGEGAAGDGSDSAGFVGFRKVRENRIRKARMMKKRVGPGGRSSGGGGGGGGARGGGRDPLKIFKAGRK